MGHPEVWGSAAERLLIAGLTGGIASGKSEVDRELERLGALVIDADEVARRVAEPGMPAYDAIVTEFGDCLLDSAGHIDRSALADIVFSDESKRMTLNGITHPAIFAEMVRRVAAYSAGRTPGDPPLAVIDAALIVDTGITGIFDLLIVVTALEDERVKRLMETRAMSEVEARARIRSQVPDEQRVEMSDITIRNDGTVEELRRSVDAVFADLLKRAESDYS